MPPLTYKICIEFLIILNTAADLVHRVFRFGIARWSQFVLRVPVFRFGFAQWSEIRSNMTKKTLTVCPIKNYLLFFFNGSPSKRCHRPFEGLIRYGHNY